jgi:hypothetical protein
MSAEQTHAATEHVASSASRAWARLAVAWAWLFLVVGCGASLVTVARGGYSGVLLTAISCAGVAAVLLAFGIWRGGIVARIFAILGIAPLFFIVSEFIHRY